MPIIGYSGSKMLNYNNIRISNIFAITNILFETNIIEYDYIKRTYSQNSVHYENIIQFLINLNLIRTENSQIFLSKYFKSNLKIINGDEKKILSFFLYTILEKRHLVSQDIKTYLLVFDNVDGKLSCSINNPVNNKFSGLRNLLMELGLIVLNSDRSSFEITDGKLHLVLNIKEDRRLSPEGFDLINRKKEEIGYNAEIEILKYEQKKFEDYPKLMDRIEHTAQKNVKAGFDIKSIERDSYGNINDCFIEVKAVSVFDYSFYLTRNELNTAKKNSNSYYLYLLPVINLKTFDIDHLKIIKNPYKNVFCNEKDWTRKIELYIFSQSNNLDE